MKFELRINECYARVRNSLICAGQVEVYRATLNGEQVMVSW